MLKKLSLILSPEQTMRLLQRFGGTAVYVPLNPGESHPISATVGPIGAARLASYFGGQTLYLPVGRNWLRTRQTKMILQLKSKGITSVQIARRLGCSERWVRMVLAKNKDALL